VGRHRSSTRCGGAPGLHSTTPIFGVLTGLSGGCVRRTRAGPWPGDACARRALSRDEGRVGRAAGGAVGSRLGGRRGGRGRGRRDRACAAGRPRARRLCGSGLFAAAAGGQARPGAPSLPRRPPGACLGRRARPAQPDALRSPAPAARCAAAARNAPAPGGGPASVARRGALRHAAPAKAGRGSRSHRAVRARCRTSRWGCGAAHGPHLRRVGFCGRR